MSTRLTWLVDALLDEGLDVAWLPDWDTHETYDYGRGYDPVGLINHHTAGSSILYRYPDPPYWSRERLQDVCNITIEPDGTVVVLNAGYAHDSGSGAPEVLEAVRNDEPLPPLEGLESTITGNPYFIDIEVQHVGDGSPIAPVQYDALLRTNKVICTQKSWDPATRLIGHREWAPDRKIDPRWNGYDNPMPEIRAKTKELMIVPGPNGEPNWQDVSGWAEGAWTWGYQNGLLSDTSHPKTLVPKEQEVVLLKRLHDKFIQGKTWTRKQVAAIAAASVAGGATVAEVIDEVVRRLAG